MRELAGGGCDSQKVKPREWGEGIRKLLEDKIVVKPRFPPRSPYTSQNWLWSRLPMAVLHVVLWGPQETHKEHQYIIPRDISLEAKAAFQWRSCQRDLLPMGLRVLFNGPKIFKLNGHESLRWLRWSNWRVVSIILGWTWSREPHGLGGAGRRKSMDGQFAGNWLDFGTRGNEGFLELHKI